MTPPITPTNIITGFLGVGKTSLIQHLLKQKPEGERWAVLVNEFGEVGIDGALLKSGDCAVKEIPGGCMCCVAGLPMQVGLTQLLRRERFDRLLIEPTGLGHPAEVLQTLQGHFEGHLEIRAVLTLIDPRHFRSQRHLTNPTFAQQLAVADVLVASKLDLAGDQDLQAMSQHLSEQQLDQRPLTHAQQGELPLHWLMRAHSPASLPDGNHGHHSGDSDYPAERLPTPRADEPVISQQHSGQGYHSCGWAIHPGQVFAFDPLFHWVSGLDCDRLKAVLITDEGIVALNLADGVLKVQALDEADDSRLEIIHHTPLDWEALGQALLAHLSHD